MCARIGKKGDDGMTIGASIRYHRKRLNLTQAQLADRVGVTAQAVSKWENDTGLPDITMAVPLARALGTTTDELLCFGERRQYFEELWMQALKQHGDNPAYLLPVAEAALKEFHYDDQFLYRAAVNCFFLGEAESDPERREALIGRAGAYAVSSIENDPEHKHAQWVWDEVQKRIPKVVADE